MGWLPLNGRRCGETPSAFSPPLFVRNVPIMKLAHGFYQGNLVPGDVGVVMKKVVMYSSQVKSDGPAYQVAWQKEGKHNLHIREFMLVPAKKK